MPLDLGAGVFGGGGVEIVNVPELDVMEPLGKTRIHVRAVLGFLQGDDTTRGGKVFTRDAAWE